MTSSGLDAARRYVEAGAWSAAVAALDECGAVGPEALELRASASYGSGDLEAALAAWEALVGCCAAAGDQVGAARAAAMLAMFLMMDTGLMAPVRAWLRRAEELVAGEDEGPVHALVALTRTYERFMCGDLEAARRNAAAAIELGTRHEVVPAIAIGRTCTARLRILDGDVEGGLADLDDVARAVGAGEYDQLTTGMMYCELICAMQGLAQYDRAREWTDLMERWGRGAAIGGIGGRCRVHRAELLRLSGPFDAAEDAALQACEELRPWMRREFGWPLAELGNIRLRRGDLPGAEEAFRAAHEHAWSPEPGLARLRLAEGRVAEAAGLVQDALDHPVDVPSKERPPFGALRRAPLLDAQVEIAVAAGTLDVAASAAAELADIAREYGSRALAAAAGLARGRVALAEGSVAEAVTASSDAVTEWTELGAPYEAASARLLLGQALAASGAVARSRLEWAAAKTTFERLGARAGAASAGELLGEGESVAAPSRPGCDGWRFACAGDTRTVSFDGREVLLRDLKGFRYLERLLSEPGREFHVLDLVAAEAGVVGAARTADAELVSQREETGLDAADEVALASYRRRLAEVDEDIAEAEAANDRERMALAARDREFLVRELSAAYGLGHRRRQVAGSSERARTSVTRAIHYALGRIREHHRPLAEHLDATVRTGTYCVYLPDPRVAVSWEV
jgi:hypothetical protein